MPKLAPDKVPGYRLHKQSGQAIVTLNGQDFLLGAHASAASRTEYARLTAEWQANGRQAPVRDVATVTVSMLLARFWDHAEQYYRTPDGELTGEIENFRHALRPLRRLYGTTPAAHFGPLALKAVREEMIRLGWCRNVVNRQTSRLRQVFKWGTENELVPALVIHGLAAVAGLRRGRSKARETEDVRPVPDAHVYAIKPHVSRPVWAMIELQLLTGMRSGEVTSMRPVDLTTSDQGWEYSPRQHKTAHHGHDRTVWLGPKARAIIEPFLTGRPFESFLFSPAEAERRAAAHEARTTPLSCGNRPGSKKARSSRRVGERYTPESYLKAVYAACDVAFPPPDHLARRRVSARRGKNCTRWETAKEWRLRLCAEAWAELMKWREDHRWHPHQLRHNAGTRLRKEYGIEAARIILGQRSAAVTELYAEADIAKAMQIMREVG